MAREAGFQEIQNRFSEYIRDPDTAPPEGIELRRMELYRSLFFNNIQSFLANSFPVLRKLMNDRDWEALIRDFYRRHTCRTPYFAEIPEEFISYLQDEHPPSQRDFPFLIELAHYEWVELGLANAETEATPGRGADQCANPADTVFALSPLVWPLVYEFPVHRIGEDFIPLERPAEPTFLAVYRDDDYRVRFLEISAMTYHLLQAVDTNRSTLREHLHALAQQMPHADEAVILEGGIGIAREFLNRGFVTVAD